MSARSLAESCALVEVILTTLAQHEVTKGREYNGPRNFGGDNVTNHANAGAKIEPELVTTVTPKAVPLSIKAAALTFTDDLHKEESVAFLWL